MYDKARSIALTSAVNMDAWSGNRILATKEFPYAAQPTLLPSLEPSVNKCVQSLYFSKMFTNSDLKASKLVIDLRKFDKSILTFGML